MLPGKFVLKALEKLFELVLLVTISPNHDYVLWQVADVSASADIVTSRNSGLSLLIGFLAVRHQVDVNSIGRSEFKELAHEIPLVVPLNLPFTVEALEFH